MKPAKHACLTRRELAEWVFGAAAVSTLGCGRLDSFVGNGLPSAGELVMPNKALGHRLRDMPPRSETSNLLEASLVKEHHDCVVVGAGVAGLTAGWFLDELGIDDYLIVELDDAPGGTSRSDVAGGAEGQFASGLGYPWGAHYLPVPQANNHALIEWLQAIGVVASIQDDGKPVVFEEYLCRDPEERVFVDGRWSLGLYPEAIAGASDRAERDRFRRLMLQWANKKDSAGNHLFAIPTSQTGFEEASRQLDRLTMAEYMRQQGFSSEPLLWLVDHACRDDYGLSMKQTSAWAGIFYFASRMDRDTGASQSVITWPQGNGFLVDKLLERSDTRLRCGHAVLRIEHDDDGRHLLEVLPANGEASFVVRARTVILATPSFVTARMVDLGSSDNAAFRPPEYGSWLVANVHLDKRPDADGPHSHWDSVLYGSPSLGYVNAGHQAGIDHGPTIWTWYHPLCDVPPKQRRRFLETLTWSDVAGLVLTDLGAAHPGIHERVTRLDAMLWGHAMVSPEPGTISRSRWRGSGDDSNTIALAHTDLSGMALFEEAFDHGRSAAHKIAKRLSNGVPA
ncbi:MAG: NAD(P)-binding protein [Planctomycetota bacterium]